MTLKIASCAGTDCNMQHDWIFFDGGCALCHRFVRFAANADKDGSRFRFAPLGGKTSIALLGGRAPENTVVLRTYEGKIFTKSDVSLHVFSQLPGWWPVLGGFLFVFPKKLRDWGYDVISRQRIRWFGRTKNVCPIPEHPDRFAE